MQPPFSPRLPRLKPLLGTRALILMAGLQAGAALADGSLPVRVSAQPRDPLAAIFNGSPAPSFALYLRTNGAAGQPAPGGGSESLFAELDGLISLPPLNVPVLALATQNRDSAAQIDMTETASLAATEDGATATLKQEAAAPVAAPVAAATADEIKAALEAWQASASPTMAKRREAIAAIYAARNYAPLWLGAQGWTKQAHAALTRIDKADEDGLDLEKMPRPALDADHAAADEILLSNLVAAYAEQAMGGRVDPGEISKFIIARPVAPDYAAILGDVAQAANADAALQAVNPPQKAYAELREKLAELRRESRPLSRNAIPPGPVLKVGMKDPRVPLIRERFGIGLEANADKSKDIVYDTRVAAAVASFQTSTGLPASGTLTPRTIAALSDGDPARLEAELVANMEIWRWMPRDMGHDRIEVNLTEFAARLYRDDVPVYETRVVIGKPKTPTPIFSNVMQFLIVNPYWNVPLSIVKKEMLPKLAEEPDYFARHGYQLVQRHGVTYVRQPPGDANALGRIKFMFPNPYSIYMHDTPSKALFARPVRAFSHGCVRVNQPFRFAQAVLGNGWDAQKVESLIGGEERTINLPEFLPVHMMYFTANVDEDGKLKVRDDLYGYVGKVEARLGLLNRG